MDYQQLRKLLPSQIHELDTFKERLLAVKSQSLYLPTEQAQRDNYRDQPAIYTVKLFDVPGPVAVDVLAKAAEALATPLSAEHPANDDSFDVLFRQFVKKLFDILGDHWSDDYSRMNRLLTLAEQAQKFWTTRRYDHEGTSTPDAIEMTVTSAMKDKKVLRFDYETTVNGVEAITTRRVRLRGYRRLRNDEWGFSAERCGQIKTYSFKRCSNVNVESNPGKRMIPEAELRLELTGAGAQLVLENATT